MSVTFIESHDTEAVRDGGSKRFPDNKIMQGYVYILTYPLRLLATLLRSRRGTERADQETSAYY
jgi:hypothetical protein